jgi:microcystin-dependent protein
MSYLAICPTGTIFAFGANAAPDGWLLCQGQAVSRTTYSQLFSVIGIANGSGDSSTTFNLPDFRGRFLRGVTGATANDPDASRRVGVVSGQNSGNNVGSLQGMATSTSSGTQSGTKATTGLSNASSTVSASGTSGNAGAHNHSTTLNRVWGNGFRDITAWAGDEVIVDQKTIQTSGVSDHNHSLSVSGTAIAQVISGDLETRPTNVYVNYIIKV